MLTRVLLQLKIFHMFRISQILLLVFSLLACPMRCSGVLGQVCAHAGHEDSALAGCACCQHHRDNVASEVDSCPTESPDEDCTCQNCLCHGALLSSGAAVDILNATALVAIAVVPELVEAGAYLTAEPVSCNAPFAYCGRDICIQHQLLLL